METCVPECLTSKNIWILLVMKCFYIVYFCCTTQCLFTWLCTHEHTRRDLRSSCGWAGRPDWTSPGARTLHHSGTRTWLRSYSRQRSSWGNHVEAEVVRDIFSLEQEGITSDSAQRFSVSVHFLSWRRLYLQHGRWTCRRLGSWPDRTPCSG